MIIYPKRYYTRATLNSAGRCVALLVGSSREHEHSQKKKRALPLLAALWATNYMERENLVFLPGRTDTLFFFLVHIYYKKKRKKGKFNFLIRTNIK
jgi:hypothetical protein